jgi:transcriptional regulator with XRE-family HTH domain
MEKGKTVTYGAFLTYCCNLAGFTKSEMSRKLGMLDPDHFIGATNDKPGKAPSRELLERAARLAGFEFTDWINEPKQHMNPLSRKHEQLHRKLQDLLDYTADNGEVADYFITGIETFHTRVFRRR